MDLKEFNLDRWWKMTAVAGALIAIASAPAGFAAGFLIGLGLLLFGVGEWSMIGRHEEAVPSVFDSRAITHWIIFRKQSAFGLALDILGVMIFALGLYRLL